MMRLLHGAEMESSECCTVPKKTTVAALDYV